MRTNEMNGQYFSVETAALLPSESTRRSLLCQELRELKEEKAKFQKELDDLLNSYDFDESDELYDERVKQGIALMDKISRVDSHIAWKKHDINRLDSGETIADIYKSIFG